MLAPWLTPLAGQCRERLTADTLPHALLLSGPPGWGETEFAGWLALTLLGLDTARDAATVAHPDLRWLEPDGRQIKVDAVRELVGFAYGTAQNSPRKAAVIAQAHCLNRNSANALLKTLEEPPPGTHLLLATSHVARLLPTIRSRCQTLVIRPDPAAARHWLAERVPAEELEARLFEHGGAPLAVAAAVARDEALLEPLLVQGLEAAQHRQMVAALLEAGLTDALARWSRYLVALAAGTWHCPGLEGVTARALFEFGDELTWTRRLLLTATSPNERLLAERLAARWRQLRRVAA